MNRISRKNIREFLGMTTDYGKSIDSYNKVEDPSYITFTLKFDFNRTDVRDYPITNGNLLSPPSNTETVQIDEKRKAALINSAYDYLLNINRGSEARMLLEFINQLKDIQDNRPWTFQKIEGLDSCMVFDRTKIWQRKDAKINIECLEYFDRQLLLLQSLYHNAVYDTEYNRFLLPKNFIEFNCDIIISEFNEKYEITTEQQYPSTLEDNPDAGGGDEEEDKWPNLKNIKTIDDIKNLVNSTVEKYQNTANEYKSNFTTLGKQKLSQYFDKSSKDKTYEEWLEEEYQMYELMSGNKRPLAQAEDEAVKAAALEKYNNAQNSSTDSILDKIINSGNDTLKKIIPEEYYKNAFNETETQEVYEKVIPLYLKSIKDKFTYTVIHCEKCTFDFNDGFEPYKSVSASAIGDFVKGKFSIKPKKVFVKHDFGIHRWVLSELIQELLMPDGYTRNEEYGVYINDPALETKNSVFRK